VRVQTVPSKFPGWFDPGFLNLGKKRGSREDLLQPNKP
jgi:hypothetical protein